MIQLGENNLEDNRLHSEMIINNLKEKGLENEN